uniref:Uncharacterized protein LOC111116420 n=1 Tax=Crassostrea virginica TaxID=6565 RepID=A0A8B8C686_CRAVI|nr:uncharacterized protein LOC111116420 [Crassostrea virginica]
MEKGGRPSYSSMLVSLERGGFLKTFLSFWGIRCDAGDESGPPDQLAGQAREVGHSHEKRHSSLEVERRVIDEETHISPKEVLRFLKSKACQEAAEFLAREDPVVTRQVYSLARNYLTAKTLLNNGQRSGAVSSLIIDHVKKATMDDGFHVALFQEATLKVFVLEPTEVRVGWRTRHME